MGQGARCTLAQADNPSLLPCSPPGPSCTSPSPSLSPTGSYDYRDSICSGSLAQAFTADRFGRKGSIRIWSVIFTIGVVIQTATDRSVAQITIGSVLPSFPSLLPPLTLCLLTRRRFVAGLGVGALSALVPLYNGEAAPKKIRGAMLVLYQLQIIFGLFLSYVIDLATHTVSNSASWRIPVGLQMCTFANFYVREGMDGLTFVDGCM